MSLLSALSDSLRATTDLARHGIDRLRLETKLKSLERQQTQALAALGRRVRELSLAGELSDDRLTAEIAEVAASEMRIAACQAEIEEVAARVGPAESDDPAVTSVSDGASDEGTTPSDDASSESADPPPTLDSVDLETHDEPPSAVDPPGAEAKDDGPAGPAAPASGTSDR